MNGPQYPWQKQLILQSMLLLLKLEGREALSDFYHEQEKIWETIWNIPLSKKIVQSYQNLIQSFQ